MNRLWKKLVIVVILCSLSFSFSACKILGSCNRVMKTLSKVAFKADPGPYVPFALLPREKEGIDHPELTWDYRWSEDDFTLTQDSPVVDENDNIYWLDYKFNFYALDSNGELKWEKKRYMEPLEASRDGLLVSPLIFNRQQYIDFDGNSIWKSKISSSDLAFAPNGYLICSSYNSLMSLDSQGKLMWYAYIEEESYDLFMLDACFFDIESNGYYIYRAIQSEQGLGKHHDFMISLSPEGKIRWKKILSENETLIIGFVPHKDTLVKDVFLLAYNSAVMNEDLDGIYTAERSLPKRIVAYSTEGKELWEIEETRGGMFEHGYAIGSDNRFYYAFNEYSPLEDYWDLVSGHLNCRASDGHLLWSKALGCGIDSGLVMDKDHSIYFGSYNPDNKIYAHYPDGSQKWEIPVELDFSFSLLLGHQKALYVFSNPKALIYCVQESR